MDLSDSGDVWGSAAAKQPEDLLGFSVCVDEFDPFLEGDNVLGVDAFSEMNGLFGAEDLVEINTITASSEDDVQVTGSKKRERASGAEEPLVLDAGAYTVLPKKIELEVSSMEQFDDYMGRLAKQRTLTANDKTELSKQRKRIRNRLYAVAKRQKEKREKGNLKGVEEENKRLKEENAQLKKENAQLRAALNAASSSSLPRMPFFALVIACSLFLVARPGITAQFGTGRALMSMPPSSSLGYVQGAWTWVRDKVHNLAMWEDSNVLFQMCGVQSNSTHEVEIVALSGAKRVVFLESPLRLRHFEILM